MFKSFVSHINTNIIIVKMLSIMIAFWIYLFILVVVLILFTSFIIDKIVIAKNTMKVYKKQVPKKMPLFKEAFNFIDILLFIV